MGLPLFRFPRFFLAVPVLGDFHIRVQSNAINLVDRLIFLVSYGLHGTRLEGVS